MTKFNPQNKETLTYGEVLSPAMEITTEKDAQQYLTDYILYLSKFKDDMTEGNTPEKVAKANLGYFAGYYDNKTRERVERLFLCSHPIFGKILENGSPTPIEASECGSLKKTLSELRS